MRQRIATAIVFTVVALWSVGASAHTAGPADMPSAPLTSPAATGLDVSHNAWNVAALAVIALLIAGTGIRKTGRVALIALTLWMGFQAGAHAVHHLGQPAEEARCAVASTTAHSSAIPSEAAAWVAILLPETRMARDLDAPAHRYQLPATHDGRAPPSLAL